MRLRIYLRRTPRLGSRVAQRKSDGRYGLLLRFLFLRIIIWDRAPGSVAWRRTGRLRIARF
jgi:hypothetical protein